MADTIGDATHSCGNGMALKGKNFSKQVLLADLAKTLISFQNSKLTPQRRLRSSLDSRPASLNGILLELYQALEKPLACTNAIWKYLKLLSKEAWTLLIQRSLLLSDLDYPLEWEVCD